MQTGNYFSAEGWSRDCGSSLWLLGTSPVHPCPVQAIVVSATAPAPPGSCHSLWNSPMQAVCPPPPGFGPLQHVAAGTSCPVLVVPAARQRFWMHVGISGAARCLLGLSPCVCLSGHTSLSQHGFWKRRNSPKEEHAAAQSAFGFTCLAFHL